MFQILLSNTRKSLRLGFENHPFCRVALDVGAPTKDAKRSLRLRQSGATKGIKRKNRKQSSSVTIKNTKYKKNLIAFFIHA